jgi:hypothetical protein
VTRRFPASIVITLVLTLAFVAVAGLVAGVRDRTYSYRHVGDNALYVTSGTALRRMTLGYDAVAADVYWIRALQYYGRVRLSVQKGTPPTEDDYRLLYPLLDLTTTLDPRFNIAYRFGAIFLAEPPPGGAGRADLAVRLLEKGLRELPDKWEYMLDIGFVHYWWTRDYRLAASSFEKASHVAGSPSWLRQLAATTLATGGDRRTSRRMWQAILESAENDWVRSHAEWRLLQLRALDQLQQLQQIVDRESPAAAARDWTPFIRAGRLRGIPVDPTGTPYEIDQNGRVQVGAASTLRPLPDEPLRQDVPRS